MAIDSHMHVNSLVLEKPLSEIKNINENPNIEAVINIGLNQLTSKNIVKIADENPKFFAAIGVHPLYIENESLEFIPVLAKYSKVVAIGEIGLDSTKTNLELQKQYLLEQLKLANTLKLPVVIHANNMNREVIELFESVVKPQYGCVFHCFQPDKEVLDYLIANQYYISFAGKITYKTAKKSLEIAEMVPDDLFLVETDSPYIAPVPFRNTINHSAYIEYIIAKLAEVKHKTREEIEILTTNNTKRLFKKMNDENH